MTVNTVGFVTQKRELTITEVPKLLRVVEEALIGLFRLDNPQWSMLRDQHQNGCIQSELAMSSAHLMVNFRYHDASRMLSIFFDCSCDYEEQYEGDKIIFSIGCNEDGKKVVQAVLNNLKNLNPGHLDPIYQQDLYYCACDTDDEWVKL
ncbi:MAG: hypothetical protein WC525_09075 [Candidatus Thermoplasmatota archaeon]